MNGIEQFRLADELIKQSKAILILAHATPDGDTIGASLALRLALQRIGKSVFVGCSDLIEPAYLFLNGAEKFLDLEQLSPLLSHSANLETRFDLIITVDTSRLELLGNVYFENERFFRSNSLINIDHHRSNTLFGDVNIIISNYASTGEVLLELFRELNYPYGDDIATCLLTAIVTDTSHFRTSNVTEHTFICAGLLLDSGADLNVINAHLPPPESVARARLSGLLLSRVRSDLNDQVVWTLINNKDVCDQPTRHLTTRLVDYLRSLQGVKVSIVFREHSNGSIKVSLRSRPGINVSEIAEEFGGGGHDVAAGFTLKDTVLNDAEALIIEKVKQII